MEDICWHVGGLSGEGATKQEFSQIGAQVVDFSRAPHNKKFGSIREIREYVLLNNIRIIHTHTPRTIFTAALALIGTSDIRHLGTKHLLTRPEDRKWGNSNRPHGQIKP